MSKSDAAGLVVAARKQSGLTWAEIADTLGTPLVWTTAALLGQHPMTHEQAQKACELLGLDEAVAESLQLQPSRGTDPAVPGCRRSSSAGSRIGVLTAFDEVVGAHRTG
jgi:cyanate lyase